MYLESGLLPDHVTPTSSVQSTAWVISRVRRSALLAYCVPYDGKMQDKMSMASRKREENERNRTEAEEVGTEEARVSTAWRSLVPPFGSLRGWQAAWAGGRWTGRMLHGPAALSGCAHSLLRQVLPAFKTGRKKPGSLCRGEFGVASG